jgi:thiamine-monophosphate kinase
VRIGPGDDAAVLGASQRPLLLTTDALVEGVHFRRAWLSASALGRRAFEVSASDIAAMGGRPLAAVLAVTAPPDFSAADLRTIVRGARAGAERAGAALAGGNLAAARALSLTVTVLGDAPAAAVMRSGGRVGDQLFVTGTLGAAALGLRILTRARSIRDGDPAVRRWQSPHARLRAGRALARARIAAAMIDLSDGLLLDAGRLCQASGVGATLVADHLPVAGPLRMLTSRLARTLALTGGEDYELLFAVRPARLAALAAARDRLGCRVSRIGELVEGRGVRVIDRHGHAVALPGRSGHQHFTA